MRLAILYTILSPIVATFFILLFITRLLVSGFRISSFLVKQTFNGIRWRLGIRFTDICEGDWRGRKANQGTRTDLCQISDKSIDVKKEVAELTEADLDLAREYGYDGKTRASASGSRSVLLGREVLTRFMQKRKKGEWLDREFPSIIGVTGRIPRP